MSFNGKLLLHSRHLGFGIFPTSRLSNKSLTVIVRIRILSKVTFVISDRPFRRSFASAWNAICSIPCFDSILHNIIKILGAVTFKSADAESSVSASHLGLFLLFTTQPNNWINPVKAFISAQNYTAGWSVIGRSNEQIEQIISFHEINVSLRIFFSTLFNQTCQSSFLWATGDGHKCLYTFLYFG